MLAVSWPPWNASRTVIQGLALMKDADLRNAILAARADSNIRLDKDVTDEMAVPAYLEGNWLSRFIFWRRLRHIIRLAHLLPNTNVLDFGCGTGILLPRLAADGRTVFATDLHLEFSQSLVKTFELRGIELVSADQWQERIPDGQMETIIAADVLEHIRERGELLSALGRKLAPGGRLVICGPTENPLYRLGRSIVGFSGHYHVTTIQQVIADATAVGLRPVKSISFPLPGPGCLFKIAVLVYPPSNLLPSAGVQD